MFKAMKNLKNYSMLVVAIVAMGVLAGCGSGGGNDADTATPAPAPKNDAQLQKGSDGPAQASTD